MLVKCSFCPFHSVTVVKTTGKGPDVTPVCTSQNLTLVLVKCWLSTERHTGETCCQLYRLQQPLKCSCDSRFTLIDVNHTVFLHLTSLTAADSGNYTCECSYERETQVLSLNITVERKLVWSFFIFFKIMLIVSDLFFLRQCSVEDDTFSGMKLMATVIIISAVATLIIVVGITCCVTLRRNPPRWKLFNL